MYAQRREATYRIVSFENFYCGASVPQCRDLFFEQSLITCRDLFLPDIGGQKLAMETLYDYLAVSSISSTFARGVTQMSTRSCAATR